MILKTVAYMCRWTFSEIILEAKLFVWKFSVIERKHHFSCEKVFLGLSKAHFKCPVQYLEKKMIKVNFTFCALFRILCVFFCSERKLSQGFQKHKLRAQRKNLGRTFLTQMLPQNVFFWFWAEKVGVIAENYPHVCHIYILRVRRNIFPATFLEQVFNHFNVFGVLVKFPGQQRTIFLGLTKVQKVSRGINWGKIHSGRKTILIFSKFWAKFFWLLAKNYRHGCRNCNLRIFSRFWGKTFIS